MRVPLTLIDFLDRGELHGPRVAVIDEPEGPASLGEVSHAEVARRARGMACALDRMGVAHGARVAIVSPNSARFVVALYGVSAFGRVLVPVNFRLNAEEVGYIVRHSGAEVLLVDPEHDEALAGVAAPHRIRLDGVEDAELFSPTDDDPARWDPDEDATASINYTSGTTARPKGVQLTHRTLWLHAVSTGWHLRVAPGDVYLQGQPLFHCNGWGLPYGLTAMGARQVMLRRVDGAEILRRVERHGVTFTVRGARGARRGARRQRGPGRRRTRPRAGHDAHVPGRRATVHDHDRTRREGAGLGADARLRAHRERTGAHGQLPDARRGRPAGRASAPAAWPARACPRSACACGWTATGRCSHAPTT